MKVTGWPHSGRRCRKTPLKSASLSGDKQSAGAVVALGWCERVPEADEVLPAPLPPTGY